MSRAYVRERGERRPPRTRREGESLCERWPPTIVESLSERRPPRILESLSERRLPRARAAKIANTARTPRDPRSVDRRKSARVAESRARVAERAKDTEREKAEVEHVLLEWLAELLAGGSKKSVSVEKRGALMCASPGIAEMDVCAGGWRGACVPQEFGCRKRRAGSGVAVPKNATEEQARSAASSRKEEQAMRLPQKDQEKTVPAAAKQVCYRRRGVECDGPESIL